RSANRCSSPTRRSSGLEARWDGDAPLRGHARVLGVTAVVRFGQTAARDENAIPYAHRRSGGFDDFSRKVDAADERELAQDFALRSEEHTSELQSREDIV